MFLDPSNLPALLKPVEAAEMLRVEVATLSTWRSRDPNRVPFVRVGKRSVRYQASVILKIIAGQMEGLPIPPSHISDGDPAQ